MKFVFASYVRSAGYHSPEQWIARIHAYLGVLESLGKQHTVISIEQVDYKGVHHQNNVEYHFLDFGKRILYFPFRLHRFIKMQAPDVIIIHGMDFPLQVIQLRLMLGKQVKIIVQSHNNKTAKGYKKILQQIADRCINAYFFTSKQMSETWLKEKQISNKKKIFEVMVGSSVFQSMDKQAARSKINIYGDPVFLWAGRLDANKDPLTVIKAFFRFAVLQPQAKLYMIYQTDELLDEIKYLLAENIHSESVILVGETSHADMVYWFNAADFFISGSHFEVFGAAVSEAMSCGCIPILTGIPSFKKITGDGACGLLYKPGDEDALFSVLQQTIKMDRIEERKKVAQQFDQHLSFDSIARKIQEITASL